MLQNTERVYVAKYRTHFCKELKKINHVKKNKQSSSKYISAHQRLSVGFFFEHLSSKWPIAVWHSSESKNTNFSGNTKKIIINSLLNNNSHQKNAYILTPWLYSWGSFHSYAFDYHFDIHTAPRSQYRTHEMFKLFHRVPHRKKLSIQIQWLNVATAATSNQYTHTTNSHIHDYR